MNLLVHDSVLSTSRMLRKALAGHSFLHEGEMRELRCHASRQGVHLDPELISISSLCAW